MKSNRPVLVGFGLLAAAALGVWLGASMRHYHRAQRLLGPGQDSVTFAGEADEAAVPVDQALAQFVLQCGEACRKRRLAHPALTGGGGKMPGFGQRDEIAQVLELHWTPP